VGAPPPTESPSAQDAKEQAKQKAGEVTGQAQEKAQEAAGQAKSRARDEIDRRSTEAGEQVSSTAGDLRSVSEQLREQGKDTPAKLADQAADRVEQVGGYLKDADSDRILSDVEDLARRQPWLVVAGGVALGFAAARFLKASSSQRYQQRSVGSSPSPATALGNGTGAAPLTTGVTPSTAAGH
jgi:gas vesicle protein